MTFPFPIIPTAESVDATVAFTDSDMQTATASVFNFSSAAQAFGADSATRRIAVGIGTEQAPATVNSVTMGGAAAALKGSVAANVSESSQIWVGDPTGTSGIIEITYSTSAARDVGIVVWAIHNASDTATDSGTDTDSNPATFALDINAGGVAVAFVLHRSNADPTFTWANLTESADFVVTAGSNVVSGAAAAFAAVQTNLSISATSSDAGVRSPVMSTVSFPRL